MCFAGVALNATIELDSVTGALLRSAKQSYGESTIFRTLKKQNCLGDLSDTVPLHTRLASAKRAIPNWIVKRISADNSASLCCAKIGHRQGNSVF